MKRVLALGLAVLICASSACAESLNVGARGGQVLKVQEELYAQGYLENEGDGQYGSKTAAAVSAFQQANGLEVTGVADEETIDMLLNGPAAALRRAQERLIGLGYLTGKADGEMGAATSGALGIFQRDNGLSITGELDEATEAALLGEDAEPATRIQAAQLRLIELGYLNGEADGNYGAQSREAMIAFQKANGLEPTGVGDEATLDILMTDKAVGDETRMVQARLIRLGYLAGKADGIFGAKSAAALKKFQQLHGLEATGEIDDATIEKLFDESVKVIRPALNSQSEGEAVRELQQKLIDYGFLSSGADGDYGQKTYNAVLAFQNHLAEQGLAEEMGVEATGEASSETQEPLFSDSYSCYLKDVRLGDEGGEVLRVERRLYNLGYLDGSADESMGEYSAACVKAFQTIVGLEATGVADKATIDALFAADAPEAERYVLHDVKLGDSAGVVRLAQEALIRCGMLSGRADSRYDDAMEAALGRMHDYLAGHNPQYAEFFSAKGMLTAAGQRALLDEPLVVYSEDILKGADAEETLRVQRRLNNLFYTVTEDGDYGSGTRTAVEKFQTQNELEVTGVADEATQKALFSEKAVGNWTHYKLVVSTTDQRVYVYELNGEKQYEQIDSFICSTGLGNSTPLGVYSSTTEPLDRWHYFYKYKCWAQYAWRIVGPIYFHSVIFSERDEDTLRWSSVYNLGHKASHGCIRLKVEDAKWIYENCEAGTIVEVT